MAVYLYDHPDDLPRFLPFTQSRPIGELRHGAWLLRERIERAFGPVEAHLSAAPQLAAFTEAGAPPVKPSPARGTGHAFVRSTFVPHPGVQMQALAPATKAPACRIVAGDETVGALIMDGEWPGPAGISEQWPALQVDGKVLKGVWEIVGGLLPQLQVDLTLELGAGYGGNVPDGCTVLGDPAKVMVDEGAIIEPHVVFDTHGGPIWIRDHAEVRTFSRLAGPLVVGEHTRVVGGQVRESSIGPYCVVHGELSSAIFLGYANKSHDGFLGHSIVGRWANLGAGTITSNLKNTYGPVRLDLGTTRIETGLTFLGTLFGDHVKTAIGTMLSTGSVIGTGANLFGSKRPAAAVAPFAWGTEEPGRVMACRMFLQTAGRVLPRRSVPFDDATKAWLTAVWEHATGQACG